MKFHTFSGETPAEALKKAQLECGENALVISTKQLRKKTISTSALYEVVVAVEEDKAPPPPPPRPMPSENSKYKSLFAFGNNLPFFNGFYWVTFFKTKTII